MGHEGSTLTGNPESATPPACKTPCHEQTTGCVAESRRELENSLGGHPCLDEPPIPANPQPQRYMNCRLGPGNPPLEAARAKLSVSLLQS